MFPQRLLIAFYLLLSDTGIIRHQLRCTYREKYRATWYDPIRSDTMRYIQWRIQPGFVRFGRTPHGGSWFLITLTQPKLLVPSRVVLVHHTSKTCVLYDTKELAKMIAPRRYIICDDTIRYDTIPSIR